jgi:hypothetical protein
VTLGGGRHLQKIEKLYSKEQSSINQPTNQPNEAFEKENVYCYEFNPKQRRRSACALSFVISVAW